MHRLRKRPFWPLAKRANTQQLAPVPFLNGGTVQFAQGLNRRMIDHLISTWITVCQDRQSKTQFTDPCWRCRTTLPRLLRREKLRGKRTVLKKIEGDGDG